MLNIVTNYATTWRYKLNASKSSILVIGESNRSRTQNRQTRSWHVCGDPLPEKDTQHHLGILRSVSPSTAQRTCAGRSAFFGLNAIGSRFGCLHPVTILRLYKVYCLPVLLYGCELWSVTQTEILMLERVHRKILRTILNLPIRCPSRSLLSITGMLSISAMIHHKQLNFLHSFSLLPADSLPRQLFQALTTSISPNYTTSKLQTLLHQHCLPPITAIPSLQLSKRCWKQAMKRILWAAQLADFLVSCSHLPLAQCSVLHQGKPIPQDHQTEQHQNPPASELPRTRNRHLPLPHKPTRRHLQIVSNCERGHPAFYFSLPRPLIGSRPLASKHPRSPADLRPSQIHGTHTRNIRMDRRPTPSKEKSLNLSTACTQSACSNSLCPPNRLLSFRGGYKEEEGERVWSNCNSRVVQLGRQGVVTRIDAVLGAATGVTI